MSQTRKAELEINADQASLIDAGSAADFISLMKPRVMSLVVFTALVGLVMAPVSVHPVLAVSAVILIALGAGGSAALNMWYDADIDAVMARTKTRSLAELLTLLLVRHSVAAAALPDLWPRPSQIDTSAAEDTLPIRFKNISFTLGADTPDGVLRKAAARYTAIIMASASFHLSRTQAAQKVGRGQTFVVSVEVADPSSPLSPGPGMNESYALEVQAPGPVLSLDPTATPCKLSAQTVWGALRGMETLAQLAHPAAGAADSLEIDGPVTITDTPRFGWRGMM